MIRALLIGREPGLELGYQYVTEPPYEAVMIGSLRLSELLRFREERVLAALAEGMDLHQAARFANALAALSVQRVGAAASMPTRAEIDGFLSEH